VNQGLVERDEKNEKNEKNDFEEEEEDDLIEKEKKMKLSWIIKW